MYLSCETTFVYYKVHLQYIFIERVERFLTMKSIPCKIFASWLHIHIKCSTLHCRWFSALVLKCVCKDTINANVCTALHLGKLSLVMNRSFENKNNNNGQWKWEIFIGDGKGRRPFILACLHLSHLCFKFHTRSAPCLPSLDVRTLQSLHTNDPIPDTKCNTAPRHSRCVKYYQRTILML